MLLAGFLVLKGGHEHMCFVRNVLKEGCTSEAHLGSSRPDDAALVDNCVTAS